MEQSYENHPPLNTDDVVGASQGLGDISRLDQQIFVLNTCDCETDRIR